MSKAVHFDDNYQVKRGDLLLELDPRDYEVALASAIANLASAQSKRTESEAQQNVAQAGLGQAKADLASAQATADNAESDFNRNEQLYKTHVIDRREYDASAAQAKSVMANVESASKRITSQEAQVRLASAQYVTASAEEKQAEAQVQQAELQLSYTKIFAPFDGRVTKKSVEPGNYVQPGQTLFSLVPPRCMGSCQFQRDAAEENESRSTRFRAGRCDPWTRFQGARRKLAGWHRQPIYVIAAGKRHRKFRESCSTGTGENRFRRTAGRSGAALGR